MSARDIPAELPPHALEAEQHVIGALLLDNEALSVIEEFVRPGDFYIDGNRIAFEHATALLSRGVPADVTTLCESLAQAGRLDFVGGLAYLGALVQSVPTAANVGHYAAIVRDRSERRRLIALGAELAAAARSRDAQAALETADRVAAALREVGDVTGSNPRPLDLKALAAKPLPQRVYRVGKVMRTGTVGLVTGHGGAGKTPLGLSLAACLAADRAFYGEDVRACVAGYYSGEDDAEELTLRLAQQAERIGMSLDDLADRLHVYALDGESDPTLLVQRGGDVQPTARFRWLQRECERRRIEVLVLDNLVTLFDGDLNVPGVATRVLALFARLVPPSGNVVVLAHVDKLSAKAGYSAQAYSGTAAWHNRARWRWFLYAPNVGADADPGEEQESADDGRRVLEVQKNNAGPSGARYPLRLIEGVLVADGGDDSIVASIARGNERKSVLAAMREANERGIPVPTARTNRDTAYEALELMPSYPQALKGKRGKQRLFRLLRELRADRTVETCEFRGAGRHRREGYRVNGVAL